ncbi:MAG: hypothetical protein P8X70_01480 [Nanoarchaeota archaeon]
MKINQIKNKIKQIAKDFDLEYNAEWFDYIWIPKRQEILIEFIGDCPDPIYKKYGKTTLQRIKNLDKFIQSKDFQNCIKRFGGQVAEKKDLQKEERLYKKISNKKIREELLNVYLKVKEKLKNAEQIALITKTNIKKEKEWIEKFILKHEWIHILLYKNKIDFQKINKKYWKYDEGLVEFLGVYIDRNLDKLEKFRDEEQYPTEKQNWIYAIKFRKLFENISNPKERKMKIKDLMRELIK